MMKANHLVFGIGIFLAALCVAPGQELDTSRDPVKLNYEWKTGKTYTQTMEMDQNSKISIGGQTMDQGLKMKMEMEMKVSAVPESGDKRIATEYTRIAMEMNAMGQKLSYDSSKPDAATIPAAAMGTLVGKPFTLVMDEKNQIKSVEGMDELAASIGEDPISKQVSQQFIDKDLVSQMMNTWMAQFFPKDAVKAGDTWPMKITMKMPQAGSISYTGNHTLAGHQVFNGHDCAVIDMEATLEMDLGGEGDESPGGQLLKQMGMNVTDGKIKSRMFWDNELGWMRGMNSEQTMTMTMGGPQGEMSMPMTHKMTMTVDVD